MAEINSDIKKAAKILRSGGLVAIPTETVYGLAGNAFNVDAVSHIFEVKNRPSFDPLIVHTHSLKEVRKFVEDVPPLLEELAEHFWPGPLTLLLEKKNNIPELVTSGMPRVAVRVPSHPATLSLLEQLDFPLVAPSANPFGYVSPTKPEHVNDQLGNLIPYILDGGNCSVGLESTIVGVENEVTVIYRLGGLPLEEIEKVTGKVKVIKTSSSNPKSPGMLKSHYSPAVRTLVVENIQDALDNHKDKKVGLLLFNDHSKFTGSIAKEIYLSRNDDLHEVASNLFSALREMDHENIDLILAPYAPEVGLGLAINDRLKRAAVKN